MKRKQALLCTALVVIIIGITMFTGCDTITGSGETVTWDMDYTDFSRIDISHAFNADITRSDTYLVRITIDEALYEYLEIRVRGDTLYIGLKPNTLYVDVTREAIITLPDLRRLELSGASTAGVAGFSASHDMDFELSGASRMELGDMEADDTAMEASGASKITGEMNMADARFGLSGASTIEMEGSADDITVEASGASDVLLADLTIIDADVHLSGASKAVIATDGRLDIDLSGASRLEYIGKPKLGEINVSGGSTIKEK